jgi:hypothetical protein
MSLTSIELSFLSRVSSADHSMGICGRSLLDAGISVRVASARRRMLATDNAFSNPLRTTLVAAEGVGAPH